MDIRWYIGEWCRWVLCFYIYGFLGWCFESAYVSVREKRLVNRGFLKLPLLPLYGTGALLILGISVLLPDHMGILYAAGAAAATWLEYVTGYGMEWLFGIKYWDYSGQRFQFQGHICLSSSLAWGILTILLIKGIHRMVGTLVWSVTPWIETGVLLPVSAMFLYDTAASVRAQKKA